MKSLIRLIDSLSRTGAVLAGAMLCVALVLFVIEIIVRTFFGSTLYVTDEYSGYLMAGATFCALAYTLADRGHIRMTFLHKILTGARRTQLEIACCVVGFAVGALLTYVTGRAFWDSVVTGSQSMQTSETYLAIPQFFLPFGSLLFTLQFFAEIMRSILILRGDSEGIGFKEEVQGLGR